MHLKLKRVDHMLSVINTHTQNKGILKTLRGVVYVQYFDYGDDITGVCICPNPSHCTH